MTTPLQICKFFRASLIQLSVMGAMSSNLPDYIPSAGLVAWYPFNGNANDESSNNNNGTVVNSELTTDREGNSNKAYILLGKLHQRRKLLKL